MNGLILVSDGHLSLDQPVGRLDDIKASSFKKLTFIWDFARDNKAGIVQAGDFFDKPRSWFLLPQISEFLRSYKDIPFYSIFGQHDTYLYSEETRESTSLGVLEKAGLVSILGAEEGGSIIHLGEKEIHLYGSSYGQEVPSVNREKGSSNLLVIHAPISTDWVGGTFIDAQGFLHEYPGFDLVLCGDIHRACYVKDGKRILLNTGPLIRRESTKYNFSHYPHFYYLTETDLVRIDIPHEPAERVLSRDHIEEKDYRDQKMEEFTSSIKPGNHKGVRFQEIVQEIIRENSLDKRVVDIMSEVMSNESAG